jgi:SAM-dependent methyltransferase
MSLLESGFVRVWKWVRGWKHYPYVTYQIIAFFFRKENQWQVMNYGYESETNDGTGLQVSAHEEERLGLQLYAHVIGDKNLTGKDVLEVGSGRGGGASFVHRQAKCRRMTGVDFSPQVVAFCQRNYQAEGLNFQVGNAQALNFPKASFDLVINVESSHNYPDREQFYGQVFEVLRPGGWFLYADVLQDHQSEAVLQQLTRVGFVDLKRSEINEEVMRAMRVDDARRREQILRTVPTGFRRFARLFAGSTSSYGFRKLESGKSRYFRLEGRKPATVG